MYRVVASSEVATYQHLVRNLARKFVHRAGAEYDDLVQEGLISVWEALRRDNRPSAEVVEYAMRQWVRFLQRVQRGDSLAADLIFASSGQLEYGTVQHGEGGGSD